MRIKRILLVSICVLALPLMVYAASATLTFTQGSQYVTQPTGNCVKGKISPQAGQYVVLYNSKGRAIDYKKTGSTGEFSFSMPKLQRGNNYFYVKGLRTKKTDATPNYRINLNYVRQYTIKFNGMGGTGSMASKKATVGQTVTLPKNKFKREGYKFVGWAVAKGKPVYKVGRKVETFKNVNMAHFQLGKVKFANKSKVKNLAKPGKTVTLYAVWRGEGPQAAADWAVLIAGDDNFTYGAPNRSYRTGCYYCGTNRDSFNGRYHGKESTKWNTKKNYLSAQTTSQKYDKTWCCNPFAVAAMVHGANEHTRCHGGNMTYDSWTNNNYRGKFRAVPLSAPLKPGDIFFSSSHVWLCGNKTKSGKWTVIDAGKGDWSPASIAVRYTNPKTYLSVKGRVRYYPN